MPKFMTPYIGLKARLSQVWLNPLTVMLFILAVKTALFLKSLGTTLDSSRQYTMTACESSEQVATHIAATPHYLALSANSMIDKSMTHFVQGTISTLELLLTGIEEIIIFYIEFLVGTYACLIVNLIDGIVDVAVNATEAVVNFTNDHLKSISQDLQTGVSALANLFTKMESYVYDIEEFFTGEASAVKQVNISISALQNLHIPSSINTKLSDLRNNMPTYDDVKNSTETVLKAPFESVKNDLKTAASKVYFNSSALSVPPMESNIEFCSQSVIDDIFVRIHQVLKDGCIALIIVFCICAVAVCAPLIYHEVCRWRWQNDCAKAFTGNFYAQEKLKMVSQTDKLMVRGDDSDNTTATQVQAMAAITMSDSHWRVRIQNLACKFVSFDPDWQIACRWYVDFILQKQPLTVLAIGILGLICAGTQKAIIIRAMRAAPELAQAAKNGMLDLSTSIDKDVNTWVNTTNFAINATQNAINDDILGWVVTGTETVNKTLSHFLSSMNSDLESTFGGTPLYSPISTVVGCVIGNKIETVIRGLTWVHNNAHVDLPLVNKSMLLNGFQVISSNASLSSNTSRKSLPATNTSSSSSSTPTPLLGTLERRSDSARIVANLHTNSTKSNSTANNSSSSSTISTTESIYGKSEQFLQTAIDSYISALDLEMKISAVLIGLWLIVALGGLLYCITATKIVQRSLFYPTEKNSPFSFGITTKDDEPMGPTLPENVSRGSVITRPPPLCIIKNNYQDTDKGTPALENDWNLKSYRPPSIIMSEISHPPVELPRNETQVSTPYEVKTLVGQGHALVHNPLDLRQSSMAHLAF